MNTLFPPQKSLKSTWYKEPWLLLVLGGPAAVVCASLYTGFLAFHGADRVVAEDYYKQGLMINKDIQRDAVAHDRNLSAEMSYNAGSGNLEMKLAGQGPFPDSVQISFAVAGNNEITEIVRRMPMTQVQNGRYVSTLIFPKESYEGNNKLLHVKIEASDWRLTGDWFEPEQNAFHVHAS